MELPKIIGMPEAVQSIFSEAPDEIKDSYNTQYKTMMIGLIEPALPELELGLESYKLNLSAGKSEFLKKLKKYGIEKSSGYKGFASESGIAIAFQSQSPFAETFSNEFGQSPLFDKVRDRISDTTRDTAFMSNITSAQQLVDIAKLKNIPGADLASDLGSALSDMTKAVFGEKVGKQIISTATRSGKIDFPMMWRNSAYSASYELNIRLYNSQPKNLELQRFHIINPIIALSQFVVPRSDDGNFYEWPLLMKFSIAGLVTLNGAYCSSMSIIKGGDLNDIAWNQRAGTVDIRMTINSLYSTMLNSEEDPISDIPTLKDFKSAMESEKTIQDPNIAAVIEQPMVNALANIQNVQIRKPMDENAAAALTPLL